MGGIGQPREPLLLEPAPPQQDGLGSDAELIGNLDMGGSLSWEPASRQVAPPCDHAHSAARRVIRARITTRCSVVPARVIARGPIATIFGVRGVGGRNVASGAR